ncbi:MAG: M90 family metallopeptidase [Pseudomonadota bacterium]
MRPGAVVFVLIIILGACLWLVWSLQQRRRRDRLRATALPAPLKAALRRCYPLYDTLPLDHQIRLDGLINQFLDEKNFYGFEGLDINDDMRVLIAAQACLLVVNRPDVWYKDLRSIYVYPAAYTGRKVTQSGHVINEGAAHRLGESWLRGPIVLSWADVKSGAAVRGDGRNVVYHEFAHRLDARSGAVDGAPLIGNAVGAAEWAQAMSARYKTLQRDVAAGRDTFFDPYGASAPAEFFAVAVEAFIEQPDRFRTEDMALYNLFARQLLLTPHEWS